ncbi:dihydroorotase [Algiphilus sp.]|uniref:dihydroorotase n=1 Tax=Algiphilus sp. TaxID=1872431 RepID=UPI003B520D04
MSAEASTDRLVLRRPDDWHVHLRDGDMLAAVARHTAWPFARAIVMPNLVPPITTVEAARRYRERILAALPGDCDFEPLMTAYLTDEIDPDEIARGHAEGVFTACKLYPAGATTNSASGVTDIRRLDRVLERMQCIGMPLLVHGEVVDHDIDIFDREAVFIERILAPTLERFPALKVVFEHITTREAVDFVRASNERVAATITAHHLEFNRNALLVGGIRPHHYCLPVAKREHHRQALRAAATSGNPKFFLGTDTAPHGIAEKESACGCAGIFSAPVALESYAKTFEEEGALEKLEGFASEYGPRFYGLPLNAGTVTLQRTSWTVPETMEAGSVRIRPFHAGNPLAWRLQQAGTVEAAQAR